MSVKINNFLTAPYDYQYILPSNGNYRPEWQNDKKIIQNYSICYNVPPVHAAFFAMMNQDTPISLSLLGEDEDDQSPEDLLKRWATIAHGAFDAQWYGNMYGLRGDMREEDVLRCALVSLMQSKPQECGFYVGAVIVSVRNGLILVIGQCDNLGSYGTINFHPVFSDRDTIHLCATTQRPWCGLSRIDILAQANDEFDVRKTTGPVSVREYLGSYEDPHGCTCRDVLFGESTLGEHWEYKVSASLQNSCSPAPLVDVSGIHLPESFYAELDEAYAPCPEDL